LLDRPLDLGDERAFFGKRGPILGGKRPVRESLERVPSCWLARRSSQHFGDLRAWDLAS